VSSCRRAATAAKRNQQERGGEESLLYLLSAASDLLGCGIDKPKKLLSSCPPVEKSGNGPGAEEPTGEEEETRSFCIF